LGERSGVNLRGEYGPTWEGVKEPEKNEEDSANADAKEPEPEGEGDKMQVDGAKTEGDVKKSVPVSQTTDKKDGALILESFYVNRGLTQVRLLQHLLVVATSILKTPVVCCAQYFY
jgi:hypothetical protein